VIPVNKAVNEKEQLSRKKGEEGDKKMVIRMRLGQWSSPLPRELEIWVRGRLGSRLKVYLEQLETSNEPASGPILNFDPRGKL
jgi:hypothetical protein